MSARGTPFLTPFRYGVPGKDWLKSFQGCYDISLRTPASLTTTRAKLLNNVTTDAYFSDVERVLDDLGVKEKPHAIWNMDD